MLLCSRMNIRPSLILNQITRLTIKSLINMTRVCFKEENKRR